MKREKTDWHSMLCHYNGMANGIYGECVPNA
jgi:hypothetical protein